MHKPHKAIHLGNIKSVRTIIAAVKATIAAIKGLIAAIAAGCWVVLVAILFIALAALYYPEGDYRRWPNASFYIVRLCNQMIELCCFLARRFYPAIPRLCQLLIFSSMLKYIHCQNSCERSGDQYERCHYDRP